MPGGALLMVRPSITTLTRLRTVAVELERELQQRSATSWGPLMVKWASLDEHVRRLAGPPSHGRHVGFCQLAAASCRLATVNMATLC